MPNSEEPSKLQVRSGPREISSSRPRITLRTSASTSSARKFFAKAWEENGFPLRCLEHPVHCSQQLLRVDDSHSGIQRRPVCIDFVRGKLQYRLF